MEENFWRRCGSCKREINFGGKYYACGISTCTKLAYCSMPCFDNHIPVMRHKDAWAEERKAPNKGEYEAQSIAPTARTIHMVGAKDVKESNDEVPKDILIVASKLKNYISVKSGMNTSASVMNRLSEIVRLQCDRAIERARQEGRKTVMDRDFY